MTHEPDDTQPPIADPSNQPQLRLVTDGGPDVQGIDPRSIYHPDHKWHSWLARARPEDLEAINELLADPQVRASLQLDEYGDRTRVFKENVLIVEHACHGSGSSTSSFFDSVYRAMALTDRMERTSVAVAARAIVTPVVASALPELSAAEVAELVRDSTDGPDAGWLGLES